MIIRSLNINDSESFLGLMLRLDNESQFMMYEPGERKTTLVQMNERIQSLEPSSGVILGAFEDGNIVGFVSLDRGFANRIRHIGYIVIGVINEASGKGIGATLLKSIDKWAIEHDVKKLELTVMSHNEKAHNLYLRSGYINEGIKRKSIQINGEFYDEYYMGKLLD